MSGHLSLSRVLHHRSRRALLRRHRTDAISLVPSAAIAFICSGCVQTRGSQDDIDNILVNTDIFSLKIDDLKHCSFTATFLAWITPDMTLVPF
ncbi:hypothetical protein ACS0TY_013071 [Phlomoides rotata]